MKPRRWLPALRPGAAVLALALGCGVVAAQVPAVALRLPADGELVWRGLPLADAGSPAGGAGMMYPAPNLVGLLAAILTHGALVEGTRRAERSQREKAADLVLEPYRPLLADWTLPQLVGTALPRVSRMAVRLLQPGEQPAPAEWLIEVVPSFSLAQDHGTVVLDSMTRIVVPSEPTPRFDSIVRVVSAPLVLPPVPAALPIAVAAAASGPADAASAPSVAASAPSAPVPGPAQRYWSSDKASALRAETAAMLAHAIDVALLQVSAAAGPEVPFRTHRYLAGGNEAIERAQLVGKGCKRVVLRTLRGTLLSAAVRPADDKPACTADYQIDG